MPSTLSYIDLEQSYLNSVDREGSAVYFSLTSPWDNPMRSLSIEKVVPSTLSYTTEEERWGAGVETHFQEISWNLRPVVNGT